MPPKRILFGPKPEWEKGLRTSTNPKAYEITMAALRSIDVSGFDAIVPLGLEDQAWLEDNGPQLPALVVPRPVRRLCHDKLLLNRRLIDLGFGDHVPVMRDRLPADPAQSPVIVKARKASFGKGIWLVLDKPVPEEIAAALAGGSHFVQDYLPGPIEYASHLLMHQGTLQLCQTIEYHMGDGPVVKGIAHKPQQRRWLTETPWQDTLLRILAALGLDEGTCCIDYRMADGVPQLFEINPRFGGSLATRVTPYLERYLACVARSQA